MSSYVSIQSHTRRAIIPSTSGRFCVFEAYLCNARLAVRFGERQLLKRGLPTCSGLSGTARCANMTFNAVCAFYGA